MKKWNDSPKIQELLSRMTLQEKIGQLNQRNICAYDEHVEEIKQEVREGKIGSLLFSGSAIPENGGYLRYIKFGDRSVSFDYLVHHHASVFFIVSSYTHKLRCLLQL